MKVTLIQYFPDALEMLLFTKATRLQMSPTALADIKAWPMEKKMAELDYMLGTIHSSWEFSDYIFVIEDVSRAFTHQLVRRRVGVSFAQQAQRAVDMSGFGYHIGPSIEGDADRETLYHFTMDQINEGYEGLVQLGARPQDARGVLPTDILTNITMMANLATLHDMALKRLCVKAQGEFQDVFRAIRSAVIDVHPWAEKFIRVHCAFHGTCAFPSFPVKDCPVKPMVYNPLTRRAYGFSGKDSDQWPVPTPGSLEEIQQRWLWNRAEAQPVPGAVMTISTSIPGADEVNLICVQCGNRDTGHRKLAYSCSAECGSEDFMEEEGTPEYRAAYAKHWGDQGNRV